MHLSLYTKQGCCLCTNLYAKLQQVSQLAPDLQIQLEVHDIATNPHWQAQYEYEVPVLFFHNRSSYQKLTPLSPRINEYILINLLRKVYAKGESPV